MRRRKDFELPPEALELIAQVSALEEKARNARQRVQQDLDGVREAAASERRQERRHRGESSEVLALPWRGEAPPAPKRQ